MKKKIGYFIKIHHKLPVPVKSFDKRVDAFVQQGHVNFYLTDTQDYTAKRDEALFIKSLPKAKELHSQIRKSLKSSPLFGADDFVSLEEKTYSVKTRFGITKGREKKL